VILLDHVLDGQIGLDVINEVKDVQFKFGIDITWVLVSSTEDSITIENYKSAGLKYFIEKPLSVNKLKRFINQLNEDSNK